MSADEFDCVAADDGMETREKGERPVSDTVTVTKPASERYENADPDWWAWHPHGWENAVEGSVRDARRCTRAQAAQFFAAGSCESFIDVRVWKRYAVPISHQEIWDDEGEDLWSWSLHEKYAPDVDEAPCPDEPPEGWTPHDYHPVWRFVHRSHPDAVPIWVCGLKGDEPPRSPRRQEAPR